MQDPLLHYIPRPRTPEEDYYQDAYRYYIPPFENSGVSLNLEDALIVTLQVDPQHYPKSGSTQEELNQEGIKIYGTPLVRVLGKLCLRVAGDFIEGLKCIDGI